MKKKLKTTGPVFNPVTKNGKFQVKGFGITKTYSAVDEAQAKWKLCHFLKVDYQPSKISVTVIEETKRTF